ncbi:hypothetical protein SKAU_G00010190 [Synaphobranchus kaupii]|uniref:Class II aldolase/adducin N-terminal domain-containing protein n=1 Tax=Synaphobranchus kaupii TaxID=118154 RepID=A0A9Q1GB13_SYNKA|nr:hypothetical protein SKAU_G00010190 [Synaphobranchus kaupii]
MAIIQNPGQFRAPRLGRPVGADAAAALAWLLGSHGEAKGWEREEGLPSRGKKRDKTTIYFTQRQESTEGVAVQKSFISSLQMSDAELLLWRERLSLSQRERTARWGPSHFNAGLIPSSPLLLVLFLSLSPLDKDDDSGKKPQRWERRGPPKTCIPPQHPDGQSTPITMATHKQRVSSILQSPSFREELDVLIQDQMKKGSSSSSLWALRQIADFMASQGSPAALPVSPSTVTMVTPINDLHGWEPASMVKGERLMRCKMASVYRLLDLYGWAQLSHTLLTLRVSKEQEHFLVLPNGLAYSEATASSLVKVNVLGEVVERGSTTLGVDVAAFSLHSAIYSARPDVRCLLHLHTPATRRGTLLTETLSQRRRITETFSTNGALIHSALMEH